jgi:hypothetical protein
MSRFVLITGKAHDCHVVGPERYFIIDNTTVYYEPSVALRAGLNQIVNGMQLLVQVVPSLERIDYFEAIFVAIYNPEQPCTITLPTGRSDQAISLIRPTASTPMLLGNVIGVINQHIGKGWQKASYVLEGRVPEDAQLQRYVPIEAIEIHEGESVWSSGTDFWIASEPDPHCDPRKRKITLVHV